MRQSVLIFAAFVLPSDYFCINQDSQDSQGNNNQDSQGYDNQDSQGNNNDGSQGNNNQNNGQGQLN